MSLIWLHKKLNESKFLRIYQRIKSESLKVVSLHVSPQESSWLCAPTGVVLEEGAQSADSLRTSCRVRAAEVLQHLRSHRCTPLESYALRLISRLDLESQTRWAAFPLEWWFLNILNVISTPCQLPMGSAPRFHGYMELPFPWLLGQGNPVSEMGD